MPLTPARKLTKIMVKMTSPRKASSEIKRAIKHIARKPGHDHVAQDNVEIRGQYFLHTFSAASDVRDHKLARLQIILQQIGHHEIVLEDQNGPRVRRDYFVRHDMRLFLRRNKELRI